MKNNFLNRLIKENKLELVEPSKNITDSYLEKSDNFFTSAKLLFKNNLYENSITMAYYSMYNSLTALLFLNGIKCENHAGSILLLKLLFKKDKLFKNISEAKDERIDKQYYVPDNEVTKESAGLMIDNSEDFLIDVKLNIQKKKILKI